VTRINVKGVRKFLLILFALVIFWRADAQPQFSQYIYNKFLINPAVAGSDGYTSFNLTSRQQWIGYSGSPQTYSLSFQSRLLKKRFSIKENLFNRNVYRPSTDGHVGIGANIFSDINGLVHKTGFSTSYSYHLWLDGETQMSFGLSFSAYLYRIDHKQIEFEDPDPWADTDFRKGVFIPDFNFGAYILNRSYSAGFSAMDLMEGLVKAGSKAYTDLKIMRSYYLFGNYDFEIANNTILEPSVLVKMTGQLRPQLDLGLTYVYDRRFWTGLTFRTGSALVANVGVRKEKLFFGYSVDYTLQKMQRASYGSHEFIIALKFGDSSRKYRWLDRY